MTTTLKYSKKRNQFENSSKDCVFNPETYKGTSYGWYAVVKKINGKTVFNTYNYSITTSKHARAIREHLGFCDFDLEIEAPRGLDNLQSAIEHYNYKIKELEEAITKPRSQKKANEVRLAEIKKYKETIKIIEELKVD